MKTSHKLILLAFMLALGIILFACIVHAVDEPPMPEIIPGMDLEKLSQQAEKTPEELANESSQYLREEWAKIVQKKLPFLWSTHQYLLSHQIIFKVLLNREYSFTWSFFIVLFVWIYLVSFFQGIFDNLGIIKQHIGWIIGIMCAVILAQIKVINFVVDKTLYLVYSQEAWWMRLVIWIVIIVIATLFVYLRYAFSDLFEAMKKAKKAKELEEKVEVLEAEAKGREEKRRIEEKYPKSEGWQQVGSSGAHFRKIYK